MVTSVLSVGFLALCCVTCCLGQSDDWRPKVKDKLYRPGRDTYITTTCSSHDDMPSSSFYTVGGRTSLVFAVKACAAVQLVLTSYASRYEFHRADAKQQRLTLGDNHNRATTLLLPDGGIRNTSTPHLLHCREFRTFWVRWGQNRFEFGRGPLVGEQTIMSPELAPCCQVSVQGVSLACTTGQSAIWRVPGNSGEYIASQTPMSHVYDHIWKAVPAQGDFIFHVKAAGKVKILLSEEYGKVSPEFIEVEIGSGTSGKDSFLRTSFHALGTAGAEFPLSKDGFKEIWLSWVKDFITVGYGPESTRGGLIFENVLIPEVDVRYIAVTCTDTKGAEWVFEDSLEIQHMFISKLHDWTDDCKPAAAGRSDASALSGPDDPIAKYCTIWLELPRSKYFMFSVAGESAAIALTQNKVLSRNRELQIILKNGGSQVTVATTYQTGNPATNVMDPNEYRDFWVGRPGGQLQVGKGHVFGEQVFMKMNLTGDMNRPFDYAGFGFLTGKTAWKVEDTYGQSITAYTFSGIDGNRQSLWRSTKSRNYIVARLKTCETVSVTLANTPLQNGDRKEIAYLQVTIPSNPADIELDVVNVGSWQKLPITPLPAGPTPLIGCDLSRQLWMSWPRDTISMGIGPIPGVNELFRERHTMMSDIGAVALRSLSTTTRAEWIIEEDGGDKIIYAMSGFESLSNATWLYLGKDANWTTFEVLAGSDVNIFAAYDMFDAINGVEIVLCKGDICESTIKERGGYANSLPSLDLKLNAHESQQFWLTWSPDGTGRYDIKVGAGDIPTGTAMLTLKNKAPRPITAFNIYPTQDYSSHFILQESGAKWGRFQTDGLSDSQFMMNVDHHQDLVFGVRACKDVLIHLYDAIGSSREDFTYSVQLGVDNKKSLIIPSYTSKISVTRDTPNILSCDEFRTFWMTWYSGQLRVGEGPLIGKYPILDFQEMKAEDIKALTLGTKTRMKAQWDIPMETAANYYDQTAPPDESGVDNLPGIIAGSIIGVILVILTIVAIVMLNRDGKCDRVKDVFSRDRSVTSDRLETPADADPNQ